MNQTRTDSTICIYFSFKGLFRPCPHLDPRRGQDAVHWPRQDREGGALQPKARGRDHAGGRASQERGRGEVPGLRSFPQI